MLLPPGTLRALKGYPDGIVTVVCLLLAFSAVALGVPTRSAFALLALALAMFHIRCIGRERHDRAMARIQVEQAAVKVEAVKARHVELLRVAQPTLQLERRYRALRPGGGREDG